MRSVKAIFHIDDLSKWTMVLENAKGLMRADEIGSAEIEIVATGEAVLGYKNGQLGDIIMREIKELIDKEVIFVACADSVNKQGLKKEDLIDFVRTPTSVALILTVRQQQGYSYIKI